MNFYDVISIKNLFAAWWEFRRGKRSKKDVIEFELSLESNLFKLHEDLVSGNWKPDSYTVFFVHDPKLRKIHKATVRDRVLYQAVYRALYQTFDQSFVHDSYSSRDFKGTHRGVKRFEEFARKVTQNYTKAGYALKCDIRKFFDSIDHHTLLRLVERKISDPILVNLIKQIIKSFEITPDKGLPLGNVTSQLFANIYLNELDQFMKHTLKARCYIRYCDDFVILHSSLDYLSHCVLEIQKFSKERLLLDLHPHKVFIRKIIWGVDFLGYVSLPHYYLLRTKTKNSILDRLRLDKLELKSPAVQSYLGMLKHCKGNKIGEEIVKLTK